MLRKLVLCFVLADNFVTKLTKRPFRSKWVIRRKCKKCGKCCQNIALKIEPRLLSSRFISELLIVRWVSWLFNFHLKWIDFQKCYLIFGCKNLNPDGTCKNYKWRPNICRNYPSVEFFDKPSLIDTCGYTAKLRT